MEERIVVGLDIGTTKIACFIGTQGSEPGKVKILGFGRCTSNGVRYGVVENLQETANAIRTAVEAASLQANYDVEEVYIGVAGMHIKTSPMDASIDILENQYQMVSQEDIERLTETLRRTATTSEGEEIIHIFPQSYSVDGRVLPADISPVGVSGKVLKGTFNVVTGNSNEIRKVVNSVIMAGYRVKDIILEPVASSYAVLNADDMRDGIALVDIGGGTTDIAVLIDDNVRFTHVLAMAGNIITNDISTSCQIVTHRAEQLKVKFGSCLPSAVDSNVSVAIPFSHGQPAREINLRTLAEIIKARVEIILGMVGLELDNSRLMHRLVNGMALTGGGANMQNIKELAMLITGIHCHIGTPGMHLEPVEDSEESIKRMESYNNTMYATGIGLVIYGLRQEEEEAKNRVEAPEEPVVEETPEPEPEISTTLDEIIVEPEPVVENEKKGRSKMDPIRKWLRRNFIDPVDEEE